MKKYDIFISYRRHGGSETAKLIQDTLTKRGYRVFLDVDSLSSGFFNEKLYEVIEEVTGFILILSKDGLDGCIRKDDWVRKELIHAYNKRKTIVPVMMEDFVWPTPMPKGLEFLPNLNCLKFNIHYYNAFIDKMMVFLKMPPRKPLNPFKNIFVGIAIVIFIFIGFSMGRIAMANGNLMDFIGSFKANTRTEVNSEAHTEVSREVTLPDFVNDMNPLKYNNHTYVLFNFKELGLKTFDECERYCRRLGGHLAIINSEKENTVIYNYLLENDRDHAFFGFTDEDEEGKWEWVDFSEVSYTNWKEGQPNNKKGEEHYAQFDGPGTGTWNDAGFGDRSWFFICEWDN